MDKRKIYIDNKVNRLLELYKQKKKIIDINHNLTFKQIFCKPKICAECRRCCNTFPCIYSPYDFLDIKDFNYMKSILDLGLLCIACEEDERGNSWYVIRPMSYYDIRYSRGSIVCLKDNKPSGNLDRYYSCVFRSIDGCLLDINFRPSEGVAYVPIKTQLGYQCISYYPDNLRRDEWNKYKDIMIELINYYKNISFDEKIDRGDLINDVKKLEKRMIGD